MNWILVLILLIIFPLGLNGQSLGEKYKEKPETQDTFFDKNHNGINDKIESKKGGKSLFKGIIEGINTKPRQKTPHFMPNKSQEVPLKTKKTQKRVSRNKKKNKKAFPSSPR